MAVVVAVLSVVLVVVVWLAIRDHLLWTSDARRRRAFPDAWGPERLEAERRRAVERAFDDLRRRMGGR